MKRVIDNKYVSYGEKTIALFAGFGFYFKQFYFAASGTLQVGDIFLLASAALSLVIYGVHLEKRDLPFTFFVLASIVINGLYFLSSSDSRYTLSILFMVYNGIIVVFLYRPMIESTLFLKTIQNTCKLILVSQFVFWVTGIGGWEFAGKRYVGTFNDPNQYGFYILSCFFCMYIINSIRKERLHVIWIFLVAVEIFPSASTGMILMYLIFIIGFVVGMNSLDGKKVSKKTVWPFVVLSFLLIFALLFYSEILKLLENVHILGVGRIVERLKYSSTIEGLGLEFFEDRGLMRIFEFPQYFLFGSGEGGWQRFKSINNEGYELHSTIIGLAYYYGVFPYCLLVKWVNSNIKKINTSVIFVYIALFLEALTLINHRQPIFWFLILLSSNRNLRRDSHNRR